MKKKVIVIAALLSLLTGSAVAGNNSTSTSSTRYMKAPRFARPLVEKWIEEYAKTQPGVELQLLQGSGSADLSVVVADQEATGQDLNHLIYIGELAVLPITARGSEAAQTLEGKHLNPKKLKQLFFLNDDFDEDVKKQKQFERLVVYSGSNATSVAVPFARHFGEESSSFRGKRISGDDLFLNTALEKDPLGVSFNALPNIFDLQSRHVKETLSIVGLDLKKDYAASFSDQGTIDEIIGVLESGRLHEVPVEKVGVSYNGTDDAVAQFLEWVLGKGTRYNHDYGLLNLDTKVTDAQFKKVKTAFTAQNK